MSERRRHLLAVVSLALMLGCLCLGIPRNAGPDEPAHLVRAAGLARGELVGAGTDSEAALRTFEVPSWAGQPDPGCYAFKPEVSASCASVSPDTGTTTLPSSAASNPPWAHIPAALGSLLPGGADTVWYSRLLTAVIPLLLFAAGFRQIRLLESSPAAAVAMLALTPAAIFTSVVVNPSGLAVAGAFAAASAGLRLSKGHPPATPVLAVGLSAVALSRSDGWMWALIVLAVVLAAGGLSPAHVWRQAGRPSQTVVVTALAASVTWAVAVRPQLIPIPTEARGLDLVAVAIGRTGAHLDEAVGLISWADTAIPVTVRYVWWLLLGGFCMWSAITGQWRRLVVCGMGLVAFVAAGWVVDVVSAPSSGLFWQGRYALPLFIASIMALAGGLLDVDRVQQRVGSVVAMMVVVVWNLSFWQALRRWGVGAGGSILPWSWGTWSSPISPLVVMVVFMFGSTGLLWSMIAPIREQSAPLAARRISA